MLWGLVLEKVNTVRLSVQAQSTLEANTQICGQFLWCCFPVWTLPFATEDSFCICASHRVALANMGAYQCQGRAAMAFCTDKFSSPFLEGLVHICWNAMLERPRLSCDWSISIPNNLPESNHLRFGGVRELLTKRRLGSVLTLWHPTTRKCGQLLVAVPCESVHWRKTNSTSTVKWWISLHVYLQCYITI